MKRTVSAETVARAVGVSRSAVSRAFSDNAYISEKKRTLIIDAATRRGANFTVVARTESLVVGSDVREAPVRSGAYVEAGADAVFTHSKSRSASEVL